MQIDQFCQPFIEVQSYQHEGNRVAKPTSHAKSNEKSIFNSSNYQTNNSGMMFTSTFLQEKPKGQDSQTSLVKQTDGFAISNDSEEFRRINELLCKYNGGKFMNVPDIYELFKEFLNACQIKVKCKRVYSRKRSVLLRFLDNHYDEFSNFLETRQQELENEKLFFFDWESFNFPSSFLENDYFP